MMQLRSAVALRAAHLTSRVARSALPHIPLRGCNCIGLIAAVRSAAHIAATLPSRSYAVPASHPPESSDELEALWNRARSFTPAAAAPSVASASDGSDALDESDVSLSVGEPQSRPLQWMLRELEDHVRMLGVRFDEIGLPSAANAAPAAAALNAATTASLRSGPAANAADVDTLRSSLSRADELLSELLASLSSAPTHSANLLTLANYRTILRLLATDSFAAPLNTPEADAASSMDTGSHAIRVSDLHRHVSPFASLLLHQVESLLPVSLRAPALGPAALSKVASKSRRLGLGWPSRDWRASALPRSAHIAARRVAQPLLYVDMERVDEVVSIVTSAPQPVQKGAAALPSSQACAASLAQLIEEALSLELSDAKQMLSRVESNPTFGPLVTSHSVGSLESNAQLSQAALRLYTELQQLSELTKRQFSDEQLSRIVRGLDSSSAFESLKQEAHVLLVSIQSLLDRGAQLPVEEMSVLLTETIPLFHLHVLALPLYRILLASQTAVVDAWHASQQRNDAPPAPRRAPPFSLRMHLPQAVTDSVLRSIGLAHADDIDVALQFLANLAGERHMTPMSIDATNDLLAAYADRLVEDATKGKRGLTGAMLEESSAHKTRTARARYNLRLLSCSLRERNHISNSILIRAMIGSGDALEALVRTCNAILNQKTNTDADMFVMMMNVIGEEIQARRAKLNMEEEKTQLIETTASSSETSPPAASTTSISLPVNASPSQLLRITARDLLRIAQDRHLVSPALCSSFLRAHAQLDDLNGMVAALEELRAYESSDRAIPPPQPTIPPLTQSQLQSGMDARALRLAQAIASCVQSPPFLDERVFEMAFETVCACAERSQAQAVGLFDKLRAIVEGLEEPRRSTVLAKVSPLIFRVLMTLQRPAAELVDAWIALPAAVKSTQAHRLESLFEDVSARGDLDAAKKLSTDIDATGLSWDASMIAAWIRCCLRRNKPHGTFAKAQQPWNVARTIYDSLRFRKVRRDASIVASLACVWMSWGGRGLLSELDALFADMMRPGPKGQPGPQFGVREWSAVFAAAREANLPIQVLKWYERADKAGVLQLLSTEAMETVQWAERTVDEMNAPQLLQSSSAASKTAAALRQSAEVGTPLWRIQQMLSGSEPATPADGAHRGSTKAPRRLSASAAFAAASDSGDGAAAAAAPASSSPPEPVAPVPRLRRRDPLREYRLFLPALNELASSGDVAQAEKVIAEFELHGVQWDIAIVNAWIRCYERTADWAGALKAWNRMKQLQLRPSRFTYLAMFLVGTRANETAAVDALYSEMMEGRGASLLPVEFLVDDFAQMVMLCDQLKRRTEAKNWCIRAQSAQLWAHMPEAVVRIAESVGGLPNDGKLNQPEWHIMRLRSTRRPQAWGYVSAIRACLQDGSLKHLAQAEELYAEMLSRGLSFTGDQFTRIILDATRCPRLPKTQTAKWLRRARLKGFTDEQSFTRPEVREIVRNFANKEAATKVKGIVQSVAAAEEDAVDASAVDAAEEDSVDQDVVDASATDANETNSAEASTTESSTSSSEASDSLSDAAPALSSSESDRNAAAAAVNSH